jgi:hypothetical protein
MIIRDENGRPIGSIMHNPAGILARDRFGNRIGVFTRTREAVAAVYRAVRRGVGRKVGCYPVKMAISL